MTNRNHTNRATRPLLLALSLAMFSSVATAGPSSMGVEGGPGKGHCSKGTQSTGAQHSPRGAAAMRLPAEVIEKLQLSDAQKLALFNAQTASQAMRDSMRQTMRGSREARPGQMQSGQFDPRAIFEQQDQRMAKALESRRAIQAQWLGFWDGLSEEQKTIVRQTMQARTKERRSDSGRQAGKPS